MAKVAHIIDRPEAEVGDKVLGICGTQFKMQYPWGEMPADLPYCANCVDVAVECLSDGANMLRDMTWLMERMEALVAMANVLLGGESRLVETYTASDAFYDEQETKAIEAAEKKAAKAAKKSAKKSTKKSTKKAVATTEDDG